MTTTITIAVQQTSTERTGAHNPSFYNDSANKLELPSRFNAHGTMAEPDGTVSYASTTGKSTAEIHFAQIGDLWISGYRFRLLCGNYAGSTLPLSTFSSDFNSRGEAVVDAAKQLLADLSAKTAAVVRLSKTQQQEVEALVAWATSVIKDHTPTTPKRPLEGITFSDFFAGVGGFHQGLARQGATCVAAVELDAAARSVYRANYGYDFEMHDDIRKIRPEMLPDFTVMCGGFPCQSFSVAGDQQGYDDPDKGALFFELIRIAAARMPKVILLENVEAFATHDGGKTADIALDALENIGYAASMQVLNAAEYGVPQQRERLFIVAIRLDCYHASGKPYVFPAGATPTRVVQDILESNVTRDQCKSPMQAKKSAHPDKTRPILVGLIKGKNSQGYRVYSTEGQGITLCAASGGPGRNTGLYEIDGRPRRLTRRECARMLGFHESFKYHANEVQAMKQFGNSVAVPVVSAIAATLGSYL